MPSVMKALESKAWFGVALVALPLLVAAAAEPTQKAVVQEGIGGVEVLQLRDVPVIEPGPGQVLIRVIAAGVNPVDWKMRGGAGPAAGAAGAPIQRIPGFDVAGVIERVGGGVRRFKVGDAVFSMIGRNGPPGLNGGYAQFVTVPAENVVAKPKRVSYVEAAGLGTAGMTGMRAVIGAKVQAGQRVFINGVAGGVGSAAAQIAKARGAIVIGTASARHNPYLKTLGVDQVVDYTQAPFENSIQGVDAVIDTVGGETVERALKTLRKGGVFVSVAGRASPEACAAASVLCPAAVGPGAAGPSEGELLSGVGKLVDEGRYKVHVDARFPLEKAGDAQLLSAQNRTQGKIILVVDARRADRKN